MDKSPGAATLTVMRTALLALLTVALVAAPEAGKRPDDDSHWQKAYPAAKPGERRIVIHLDAKPDEDAWKVEIIVGRMMETDGVNRMWLGGQIEERAIEGWGYSCLVAKPSPSGITTRIGVPPGQKPVMAFVSMPAHGPFRYNSKLPVVVYVPQGYEVRYRLWKVDGETRTGEEG